MPMPQRSHARPFLNEHLSPRLAAQLRRQGFDAISSQEAKRPSEGDEEQLAFAASEQRALVTFNVGDFVRLHEQYVAEGRQHWGHHLLDPGVAQRPAASAIASSELGPRGGDEEPDTLAE